MPLRTGVIGSFWFGMTLPFRALRLILSTPSLILLSLIPIVVTLLLYGVSFAWLEPKLAAFITAKTGAFAGLLVVLERILLFVSAALSFSFLASIVGAPFNDFLAERAERSTLPALLPAPPASLSLQIRRILLDLVKALVALLGTIMALLLSWVPFLNVAGLVLVFLLITFQFISYAQTRRNIGVSGGLGFLLRHFFACLGFGITIFLLFSIPLVSSLAVPLAVVGGTWLVARAEAPGLPELR